MNLPNRITIFRLFIIPIVIITLILGKYLTADKFFITFNYYRLSYFYLISGISFIAGSISDFFDGYIARKYNQVTDFGKFFDPIADKLLVNSTLILFSWIGMVPVWVTLILILRDIFVDFIRMILSGKNETLAADGLGKLKTIFQMTGLSLIFFFSYVNFQNNKMGGEYGLYNQLIMIPMYLALFFSCYSGINYFVKSYSKLFGGKKNV